MPYESLVREYHALVYHVARGVLRDSAAAEDCAQEVFLSFLEKPEALEGASNLKAFVCRAAMNRALDMAKAGRRRERRENLVAGERRAAMDPVEAAFRSELRAKVGELPEEQRAAVDLHYFRGLTLPEAAEALGVPAGTVSSRISTALGRLRQALGAACPERAKRVEGAAFAALLAKIESELSACEASVPVPPSLAPKLLQLSPPRAVSVGRKSGAAAVGAAAFLALIGATGFATWRAREAERAMTGAIEVDSGSDASEKKTPDVARGPEAGAPEGGGAAAKAAGGVVLQGFLVRRDGRAIVREIGAWDHAPVQTIWNAQEAEETAWRESLTIANAAELGLEATDDGDFGEFLCETSSRAPRTYVRLRVRAERPPSQLRDEASRHEAFLNGVKGPKPTDVKAELVSVEVLSAEWLEAWRDCVKHLGTLSASWSLEPGLAKRTAVLDAATRVSEAYERMKAARRGDRVVAWRVRTEWDTCADARLRLAVLGFEDLAPKVASPDELRAVLEKAESPAALRAALTSRWGEDALALDAWCRRVWRNARGEEGGESVVRIALGGACAMSDGEFAEMKKDLSREEAAEEAPRTPENDEIYRAHLARVSKTGLEVTDLTDLERRKYVLEHGVLVTSVVPGSAAAEAGLVAGDVIWRVHARNEGKGERGIVACPVANPVNLGWFLQGAGESGEMALDVVRESGVEKLLLKVSK